MTELISRQAALDALDERCESECEYSKKQRSIMCNACYLGSAKDVVEELPTVDAVPVVRCKDCKYGDELCGSIICLYHNADGNYCEDGGFCAWGERRTDGND